MWGVTTLGRGDKLLLFSYLSPSEIWHGKERMPLMRGPYRRGADLQSWWCIMTICHLKPIFLFICPKIITVLGVHSTIKSVFFYLGRRFHFCRWCKYYNTKLDQWHFFHEKKKRYLEISNKENASFPYSDAKFEID